MIISPFTPVTNCAPGSSVVTSAITITTAASNGTSLSVQAGSFAVVNGVRITSFPVTLHNGDHLAVGTTSSVLNNGATYVSVVFGTSQYVVTFVTAVPAALTIDPQMADQPIYERLSTNGTSYTSSTHTYSVFNNGSITQHTTAAAPVSDGSPYSFVMLDPYRNSACTIGSDGVLSSTFPLKDKSWTYTNFSLNGQTVYCFGLFEGSKIALTTDGIHYTDISVDGNPVAIASNANGSYIWVATTSGMLYCFAATSPTTLTTVSQVNLGAIPTGIALDSTGNSYVIVMGAGTLTSFSPNGTNLGSIPVGDMPFSIVAVSDVMFVSCSQDQAVAIIDGPDLVQIGTINLPEFPGMLTIDPTTQYLCISCLSSVNVYRYTTDSSFAQVDITEFGLPVLVAYSFGSTIIADQLQNDARSYTIPLYANIPGLGFFTQPQAPISSTIRSTQVTVTQLAAPVPISIPTSLNASIVLNGTNIGTSGVVSNNEQFYIQAVTPSTSGTLIQIPVAIGNYVEPFVYTTEIVLSQPNSFYWAPVVVSAAAQPVTSPSQTITGLSAGSSVIVSSSTGTLFKNGNKMTGTFTVKNGDIIQLTVQSNTTFVNAKVAIGSLIVSWFVYTSMAYTGQTYNQTITSLALSTTTVSSPYTYSGTISGKLTFNASPGIFSVQVNGVTVSSPATVYPGSTFTITATSSAIPGDTKTFVVTDGSNVYTYSLTNINNIIPFPVDFGVMYDVFPGIYSESLDATISGLTAPATLQITFAGSFYVNDVDSTLQTLPSVSNGATIGLNVRGQLSKGMTTLPVYALDVNGNQVQFGSVRIIPVTLQGGVDSGFSPDQLVNALSPCLLYSGIKETDVVLQPISVQPTGYDTLSLTAVHSIAGTMETDVQYSANSLWSGIKETDAQISYQTQSLTSNHESSLQYSANPSWSGIKETDALMLYQSQSLTSNKESALQYSANSLWSGIRETDAQMLYQVQCLTNTNEINNPPNWYSMITTTHSGIPFGYEVGFYGWHETYIGYRNATWDAFVGNKRFVVTGNTITYFGNHPSVKPAAFWYGPTTFARWKQTGFDVTHHTVGMFKFQLGTYLTGMWTTSLPIPTGILLSVSMKLTATLMPVNISDLAETLTVPLTALDDNHFAVLSPSATGLNGNHIVALTAPLVSIDTGDSQELILVDSTTPIVHSSGTNPAASRTVIQADYNTSLVTPNNATADLHQAITYSPMSAMWYTDLVSDSLQNPALYGAFLTQAAAADFIQSNSLTNAHTLQLSNGYWIVISDAGTDIVCPINASGTLYPIAWLLGGG